MAPISPQIPNHELFAPAAAVVSSVPADAQPSAPTSSAFARFLPFAGLATVWYWSPRAARLVCFRRDSMASFRGFAGISPSHPPIRSGGPAGIRDSR